MKNQFKKLSITVKENTPEEGYFTAVVEGPLTTVQSGYSKGTARSVRKAVAFALDNYATALKTLDDMERG